MKEKLYFEDSNTVKILYEHYDDDLASNKSYFTCADNLFGQCKKCMEYKKLYNVKYVYACCKLCEYKENCEYACNEFDSELEHEDFWNYNEWCPGDSYYEVCDNCGKVLVGSYISCADEKGSYNYCNECRDNE